MLMCPLILGAKSGGSKTAASELWLRLGLFWACQCTISASITNFCALAAGLNARPAEHFSQSAYHSLPHYSMPGAFRNDLLLPSTQANLHSRIVARKVGAMFSIARRMVQSTIQRPARVAQCHVSVLT